jgi:hypothetical protein
MLISFIPQYPSIHSEQDRATVVSVADVVRQSHLTTPFVVHAAVGYGSQGCRSSATARGCGLITETDEVRYLSVLRRALPEVAWIRPEGTTRPPSRASAMGTGKSICDCKPSRKRCFWDRCNQRHAAQHPLAGDGDVRNDEPPRL